MALLIDGNAADGNSDKLFGEIGMHGVQRRE